MGDAPEVDTDDELKPITAGDYIAEDVDTDEDLRRAQASTVNDRIAWCLWGKYQPARIKTVQQGMYHVRFDDGSTRWTTCSELVLSDQRVPLRWLQPGAPILRPEENESQIEFASPKGTARSGKSVANTPRVNAKRSVTRINYVQGTLVRRAAPDASGAERWDVRCDSIDAEVTTHAASELRLPIAHGGLLGSGGRVQPAMKLYALRGEWRRATLHGGSGNGSRSRGRHIHLDLGGGTCIDTWVSGGQLVADEAAEPAALVPGTRCVAHVPSRQLRPHVEVGLIAIDEEGESAQVISDDGKQFAVSLLDLHTRLDVSFRVICASGGFQRATVVGYTPDGMYCCRLQSGSERWVSATGASSPQISP